MRKWSSVVVLAAVAMATVGVGAGTANAAPKAPNSFVEMTESWELDTVIRLWWNTANGGIHAEINSTSGRGNFYVEIDDSRNGLTSAHGSTGPVNTREVFTNVSIHACGANDPEAFYCTGNT